MKPSPPHAPTNRIPSAKEGDTVRTNKGQTLRLGPRLGGGLQGAVYAVADSPDLCVKVYAALPAAGPVALRERISRLCRLEVSQTLVLPTEPLEQPHFGYLMPKVSGHRPIGELCEGQAPIDRWFTGTGGLRKRLLLGQLLARSFHDLHTRGLAYGDISFGNLLVSMEGTTSLRVIDCDNLSLDGACDLGVTGTPWFIAPELLSGGRRPDAHTDAWSLAVLLYMLLTLRHPLLGDEIRKATPDAEDRALRGQHRNEAPLPWVDHPTDDHNRSTGGLGPRLTVSPGVRSLFEAAFGPGLADRHKRPTEGQWAEALSRAVDAVLLCPACGATSYLGKAERCPWCEGPLRAPGLLYIWHSEGKRPLTVERRRLLYPRHLSGRTGSPDDAALAEIGLVAGGLELKPLTEPFEVLEPGAPEGGPAQRVGVGRSVALRHGAVFQLSRGKPRAEVVLP